MLLTPPWASPIIDRADGSWTFAVGSPQHRGRLLDAPLDQIDGQFALARYISATDEILVATDPWGARGVYFAEQDGRTYVSTSALALAVHLRPRPNRLGLALFLRTGYQVGTQTAWDGIERLDPGTSLQVTEDATRQRFYWRPEVDPSLRTLRFDDAIDLVLEISLASRHALADEVLRWADLTGGYDTRLNTILLDRAGAAFETYTRGDGEADDVVIARELARLAGWEWKHFSLPAGRPQHVATFLPLALGWGDGQLDAVELSRAFWFDAQRASTHRGVISGGGGEFLRNFASQQEFFHAGRTSRVNYDNWIDMRLLHPVDTSVLATDPTAEVREDLRRRMTEWAEPYAEEPNTTQLDALYLYKCTGHFGAFMSATAGLIDCRLPFFSKPLITTAMSIQFRHRRMERLVRRMIDRLDPRLAAVPTTWGGPAQPLRLSNLHRFAPFYADLGRRAANKIAERTLGRHVHGASQPPDERRVAEKVEILRQLSTEDRPPAAGDMRSAALYHESKLNDFLRRARGTDFGDDALLGRVVTVELALRAADAAVD